MTAKLNRPTQIDAELIRLHTQLRGQVPGSQEYNATLDQAIKLHKQANETHRKPVSNDTLATIGANLTGILLILNFERMGVITSKALTQLLKR